MGPIQSLLLSHALDAALKGMQNSRGISQSLETLNHHARKIESKLERLIDAPFVEAHMFLREGDLHECKKKLIQAMSLDELNLPAMAMYAWLLLASDNISLACEYFGTIVDRFGIHDDLIPTPLLRSIREYYGGRFQPPSFGPCEVSIGYEYYPTQVVCSLGGIASRWVKRGSGEGYTFLALHTWKGAEIFNESAPRAAILALTNTFIAYSMQDMRVTIRRLPNAEVIAEDVPPEKLTRLFASDGLSTISSEKSWPPGPATQFGLTTITAAARSIEEEETFSSQYGDYEQFTEHEFGVLRVASTV